MVMTGVSGERRLGFAVVAGESAGLLGAWVGEVDAGADGFCDVDFEVDAGDAGAVCAKAAAAKKAIAKISIFTVTSFMNKQDEFLWGETPKS